MNFTDWNSEGWGNCGECILIEDELMKITLGDNLIELTLWGFVDYLNDTPTFKVLSKFLFLFLCIYLLTLVIFICICSFNLAIGNFCKQNRKSKIKFGSETVFVLIVCL